MLQALGFAHVGIGLYLGVVRDDMWKELYLALSGVAFFWIGRLLERNAGPGRVPGSPSGATPRSASPERAKRASNTEGAASASEPRRGSGGIGAAQGAKRPSSARAPGGKWTTKSGHTPPC